MKKTLIALMTAGTVAFAAPALAAVVALEPNVQAGFYSYIETEKIPSAQLPSSYEDSAPVPQNVELYEMPEMVVTAAPAYAEYRYYHANERIYVVEPGTRRVVTVINR